MAKRVFGKRIRHHSKWHQGKSFLEIIEEAVQLVRTSPLRILAPYYIGSLPFVLALLYFWTDMTRGAFAYRHCAEAALELTVLFIWMKSWQSVFTHQLLVSIRGEPDGRLGIRRILNLTVMQTIMHAKDRLLHRGTVLSG